MCYPFPGPRCSAHTRDILRVAKSAYEATPTEERLEDYRKAKFAYQQSPAGIKDLREQASDAIARKDYDAAIEYTKLADVNERSRASSIAAWKAQSSLTRLISEAQVHAEVPSAFKRQWIGNDYTDDDLIGSALDRAEKRDSNYDVDASYEVDAENDRIIITAEWNLSEEGTLAALENESYGHLSPLIPIDYRPSHEEAEEIAKQLNADYLANVGQQSWDDDEAEHRARWRNSVSRNIVENVARDDEALASHIRENVIFNETLAQGGPYSGGTVLEAWDELFGDEDED